MVVLVNNSVTFYEASVFLLLGDGVDAEKSACLEGRGSPDASICLCKQIYGALFPRGFVGFFCIACRLRLSVRAVRGGGMPR